MLCIFEILLRIDLDIPARRIDVREVLAVLDHVLKQKNLVGLFKAARFAPRPAGEFRVAALIILSQPRRPGRREFRYADILTVRVALVDLAVDPRDAASSGG
jgi:hypothetical protein